MMEDFIEDPFVDMKVRSHCGSPANSLDKTKLIPRTMSALLDLLNEDLKEWVDFKITEDCITIGDVIYDERIDWYSRLVIVDGWGPWGYIDDRPNAVSFDPRRSNIVMAVDWDTSNDMGRFIRVDHNQRLFGWAQISPDRETMKVYLANPEDEDVIYSSPARSFSIRTV